MRLPLTSCILITFLGVSAQTTVLPENETEYRLLKTDLLNRRSYSSVQYRGLRPSDPNGDKQLNNPERGFRLENFAEIGPGLRQRFNCCLPIPNHWYNQDGDELSAIYQQAFNGDRCFVSQQYFYLNNYLDKDLDDSAFFYMKHIINQAEKANIKLLVRFAYRYEGLDNYLLLDKEPSLNQVIRHIQQLKDFMESNKQVIYAFQLGLVGIWGELHSTRFWLQADRAHIYQSFIDATPANRKVTMRYKPERDLAVMRVNSSYYQKKVGFNNDHYTLDDFSSFGLQVLTSDYPYGTPAWTDAVNHGPHSIVDIELPYDTPQIGTIGWGNVPDDFGFQTIRRFSQMGVTTLSLPHGYYLQIDSLRRTPLTYNRMANDRIVTDDDYFIRNDSVVPRMAYDYLRDHLGYCLSLEEAAFPNSVNAGEQVNVLVKIKNHGFSKPVNPRPVYVAWIDSATNQPVKIVEALSQSEKWYPDSFACIFAETSLNDIIPEKTYRLALWLPDESTPFRGKPLYDIILNNGGDNFARFENDKYRMNIFGRMNITGTATSIKHHSAKPFKLYPNPAEDKIFISLEDDILSLSVYDANGKEMAAYGKLPKESMLSLALFPSGEYWIKAQTAKGICQAPFIKK